MGDFKLPDLSVDSSITALSVNNVAAKIIMLRATTTTTTPDCILYQTVNLSFISENGEYQLRKALNTIRRVDELSAYITECIETMTASWHRARQPLDRRLESIESTNLSAARPKRTQTPREDNDKSHVLRLDGLRAVPSSNGIGPETALVQLALTGSCSHALKEWITEEMGTQVKPNMAHVQRA